MVMGAGLNIKFGQSGFLRGAVRIDHFAGLVLIGPHDDFMCGVLELIHRIAGDVLELGKDNTRFGPLTVFAERDVANNGMEGVIVHVGGELHLIQSFCTLDSLG
jgi:hypothetical protein